MNARALLHPLADALTRAKGGQLMHLRRRVLPGALSLLAALPAETQAPLSGEFRINEHTTGAQREAQVAADGSGSFVIVWQSDGQDGSAYGIFGRRYDAAGNPRGPEFPVNTHTTDNQMSPMVSASRAGNFVVVWDSHGQDGDSFGIVGRLFDASGSPLTPDFVVNTYTTGVQAKPGVAMGADGDFVVVWESYFQDGTPSSIFGQRYDAAGNPLGGEFQVNSYTTGGQYRPVIVPHAWGGFVVVWESYGQEGAPSSYGIFGRQFDALGQALDPDFAVNTTTAGNQMFPAVASDRRGVFTVAWSSPDSDASGIFGQRYDGDGLPLGGEFPINAYTTSSQLLPALANDANENLMAAWASFGQDGSGAGVFARGFDCDGLPAGNEFQANVQTTGAQSRPAVAAAAGDLLVVWEGDGQDGSGTGIFGRRFRGASACGRFHAITPCRLADTRGGNEPLFANVTRLFLVGGSLCGIPRDARAVALNVTVVNPTDQGHLRIYPLLEPVPLASVLNFVSGRTRASNVLMRLGGPHGFILVRPDMPAGSTGRTHLVLDAFGYFR
jgi:hypothetical protein